MRAMLLASSAMFRASVSLADETREWPRGNATFPRTDQHLARRSVNLDDSAMARLLLLTALLLSSAAALRAGLIVASPPARPRHAAPVAHAIELVDGGAVFVEVLGNEEVSKNLESNSGLRFGLRFGTSRLQLPEL